MPDPITLTFAAVAVTKIVSSLFRGSQPADLVDTLRYIKGYPYGTLDGLLVRGDLSKWPHPVEDSIAAIYPTRDDRYFKFSGSENSDSDGDLFAAAHLVRQGERVFFEAVFSEEALAAIPGDAPVTFVISIVRNSTLLSRSAFTVKTVAGLRQPAGRPNIRVVVTTLLQVVRAGGRTLERGDLTPIIADLCEVFSLSDRGREELRAVFKETAGNAPPADAEIIAGLSRVLEPMWTDHRTRDVAVMLAIRAIQRRPDFHTRAHLALLGGLRTLTLDADVHTGLAGAIAEIEQALARGEAAGTERMRTCCRLLGIAADASLADIRAAYRAHIREVHPDRMQALPEQARRVLEEHVKTLNEAYDYLVRQRSGGPGT